MSKMDPEIGDEIGEINAICEVNLEWKIFKFFSLSKDNDSFYYSRSFFYLDCEWYLEIHPNICIKDDTDGLIRLFLVREDEGRPKTVKIKLGIKKTNGTVKFLCEEYSHKFTKDDQKGEGHFLARCELLKHQSVLAPSGTLTVICTIRSLEQHSMEEPKSVQTSPYLSCLKNLSLDFGKLMNGDFAPDVQLKCGDYICPAHKLILGARSEVFSAMLKSDMLEGREGFVEIVDMDPEVFKIFLHYIYTGVLPELTESTASLLYQASDKYQLESLKGRCSDFLVENLTTETACGIFAMADTHSDSNLKERVLTYILDEKIPINDDVWSKFYKDHLELAFEVLNRSYKISNCSQ